MLGYGCDQRGLEESDGKCPMKFLKELIKIPETVRGPEIVHFISDIGSFKQIDPCLSSELVCPICESSEHAIVFLDPASDDTRKVWICIKRNCRTLDKKTMNRAIYPHPMQKRSVEWVKFCEISGIGDVHYDVRFEKVKQSDARIRLMLKFAGEPSGVLLMCGSKGTGKTYCAMGICELYTRKQTDVIFLTHRTMIDKWLESKKDDYFGNFMNRLNECNLLIIDDFGLKNPSPAFLEYFMGLMDLRLQWKNRGTVITTNLDDDKLSNYCGEALSDRILTGHIFKFVGESRRTKNFI